jgi:hypothetical protein
MLRTCWSLILLAVFSQPSFAGIRPSFEADSEAWRSTDIVLVLTSSNDGVFEVIETWKGDLRAGERIVVPELIPTAHSIPISHYPDSWPDTLKSTVVEQVPREPEGSRMVLFLRRNSSRPGHTEWEPANFMDSMKASAVWINGGRLFCFTQVMNPGPSILQIMGSYSEESLRKRVSEVSRTQKQMKLVLAAPESEERARLLTSYVHSDISQARQFAVQELGKSGPMAVPTIRGMLDDPAYTEQAPDLIEAMVKAGGDTVGEDLNRRFQREVKFWKSTGPSLPQGWWNNDARPDAPLRVQYSQTYQLIIGLQQTRYAGALGPAKQLHDLWFSLPQLNDPSGINRIARECEKLISLLQSN